MLALRSLRRILRDRRGIVALEYAVMGGGLVVMVAIAGMNFGASLNGLMSNVTCAISGCAPADTSTPPPSDHHHHDD